MTTKIEVLALVQFLGATLPDANECSRIFDEVMLELAHDPRAWCSNIAVADTGMLADAADPTQFELPDVVAKLLAVFYSGRELSEERIHCLAGTNVRWRDEIGDPWAYTRQSQNGRELRLYPKPRRVPVTGGTITAYDDQPLVIYCDARTTNIPSILCLPLALLVLAREFERESHHRDLPAAEIWRAMGQQLLTRVY